MNITKVSALMNNPDKYFGSITDLLVQESLTNDQKVDILYKSKYREQQIQTSLNQVEYSKSNIKLNELRKVLKLLTA